VNVYRFWWDDQNIEHIADLKLTTMPKLPNFKTDEELIAWFDSHATAAYMDEMEPTDKEFPVSLTEFPTRPVDLRLRADFLSAIEALAERRGVPYQRLMQIWLLEKLRQEALDLVPQSP
jgi:predicted DNA binding CopG/RHH family protein